MKTVDKLMLKSYLGPMVMSFFIVMFVLMMNFLWKFVDELVGKGLGLGVIMELMMHAVITLVPMGLPLATLFGAIMTMGNLGENYELLAMKSAGMSLLRILRPVIIVVGLIAIGSFFVYNNLVPYSSQQMSAIIYDVRNQKQTIDFKDGIFFTEIDDMAIRVGKQVGEEKLLLDVLIYDNSSKNNNGYGNMSVTLADSGYIKMSDDKQNLLVTLYDGSLFQQKRGQGWYDESELTRNFFAEQNSVMPLAGFDFSRTNSEQFSGASTKNVVELQRDIDSLDRVVAGSTVEAYGPLFTNYVFARDNSLMIDSLRAETPHVKPVVTRDSIDRLDVYKKQQLWKSALTNAQNSQGAISYDENTIKNNLADLYKSQISFHQKVSLPISIMIFFLIGAALGAIIRKGGLGMPVVVSVGFFVVYYIISIFGEKLAKEGTLTAFQGIWMSTFILLPLAIFLLYKATNDSNLFNAEWYIYRYRAVKRFIRKIFKKQKHNGTIEQGA